MTDDQRDPDDEAAGRPRHRRRRWIAVAVLAVLAIGVGVFAVLWNRTTARPLTVEEARRRLGATTTGGTVAPTVLRPAAGVYAYAGGGTDAIDKPARQQAEGPTMPATVTYGASGCWTFRIDYSSAHWQTWDYCSHGGDLVEMGGRTYQKWDFVAFTNESTSTFTCSSSVTISPTQHPGDRWTQDCHGSNGPGQPESRTVGPYRYVGPETIDVGGTRVATFRYHRERTMTGAQAGTEVTEAWFSAATGLPVRNERRIAVTTGSVIGDIHYTEVADFHLTAPTPTVAAR